MLPQQPFHDVAPAQKLMAQNRGLVNFFQLLSGYIHKYDDVLLLTLSHEI